MKHSLQLKMGQQLTMTPQLQQAIKLLQLSTLDLQQEIQSALESNPMLEVAEESEDFDFSSYDSENAESGEQQSSKNSVKEDFSDHSDDFSQPESNTLSNSDLDIDQSTQQMPEDLPVDSQWEDTYSDFSSSQILSRSDDDYNFDNRNSRQESLQDHLMWQLNVTKLVDSDRAIATAIIDAIEPSGFLSLSPDEIFQSLEQDLNIELEDFEAVRALVQQFDPLGCGSANLQDCLLVQLRQFPSNTPFVNDAILIVDRYIQLLATHDYAQLKRRTKFKEGRLRQAIELIQGLDPTPGDAIDDGSTEYITPDVYVSKDQSSWLVSINEECSPKLRINSDYASLVKRADNSTDNQFLRDNLQEARWFIKSLQSRNETLLKVASKIVEYQRGFLEHGEEAMKPLVLSDIANDIDMHESTISRVTTRKYVHTPRGIFELKYFFSSHVSTDTGGECSSTAIRAMIKKLISQENTTKPLSDSKITSILSEQGVNVARRTVAKYRESMSIPPSNERKRLS
jgi:RNA polymerase sigma-54 factor